MLDRIRPVWDATVYSRLVGGDVAARFLRPRRTRLLSDEHFSRHAVEAWASMEELRRDRDNDPPAAFRANATLCRDARALSRPVAGWLMGLC